MTPDIPHGDAVATEPHERESTKGREGKCAPSDFELLLCAVSARFHPEASGRLNEMVRRVADWNRLLNAAHFHGVLPLFYHQLESSYPGLLADPDLAELCRRFEDNTKRTLLMTAELAKLLRLFEQSGIQAIPYKGPVLAKQVYGDWTLRRADDLDILVRKENVWRVREILRQNGFCCEVPIRHDHMAAYARSECDLLFFQPGMGLWLEIHWALAPPYFGVSLDTRRFWVGLGSVELAGLAVPVFAPELLLFILCLHGSKHAWERLEWTCCIAELLRNGDLNWPFVLEQAKGSGRERILLLGLLLAHRVLEAALPSEVVARIRETPAIEELADAIVQGYPTNYVAGFWSLTKFRLRLLESFGAQARYCLLRVLTPSYVDLGWVRLPRPLQFLYYFLRPVRMAIEWLRSLAGHW
jgi:hypothetical protein